MLYNSCIHELPHRNSVSALRKDQIRSDNITVLQAVAHIVHVYTQSIKIIPSSHCINLQLPIIFFF